MKKIFYFFVSGILLSYVAVGQVNLTTGGAQFSLDLFNYSNQNNLSTQVSLDYKDGNGLKVNEVGSSVGTGWDLNFGGSITRIQKGLPDDQKRDILMINPLPDNTQMTKNQYYNTYFPNGYLFSAFNVTDNITNEGGFVRMRAPYFQSNVYFIDHLAPQKEFFTADREQDIFSLSIGKRVVEFVLEKNGSPRTLDDSKLKIEVIEQNMLSDNIITSIAEFKVTDENGIQYLFSNRELSQSVVYDKKAGTGTSGIFSLDETPQPIDPSGLNLVVNYGTTPSYASYPANFIGIRKESFVVNKWHLTEILNPSDVTNSYSGQKIIFSYDDFDLDMPTQKELQVGDNQVETIINHKEIVKAKRITQIVLPSYEVNFIYQSIPRLDAPQIKPIYIVQIKHNDQVINQYHFIYQYFYGSELLSYFAPNITTDKNFLSRLCLRSIQKLDPGGLTGENPYIFTYNQGSANSNWQAASGNPGIFYAPKDLVPPMFSLQTDHWGYYNPLSQRSIFITGFAFPANYSPPTSSVIQECNFSAKQPSEGYAKNGIIKTIQFPTGGSISYDYEQNTALFNGQNVFNGGVRVKKTVTYDGIDHMNDQSTVYRYILDNGTSSSGWSYETPVYSMPMSLRVYKQAQQKYPQFSYKPSSANTIMKITNTVIAVGNVVAMIATGNWADAVATVIISVSNWLFRPNPPEYEDRSYLQSQSSPIQAGNFLPPLYSRVEVSALDRNNIFSTGKIAYTFSSRNDYPLYIPTLINLYSNEIRFTGSFYGLLKKTTIYNNNGQSVSETENTYQYKPSTGSQSKEWLSTKTFFDAYPSTHSYDLNLYDKIWQNIYTMKMGHAELISVSEKTLNPITNNFEQKVTNYQYNPNSLNLKYITTTDSKGNTGGKTFYYPEDYNYNNIPSLLNIVNSHILSAPISVESWINKSNSGNGFLLSDKVINYSTTPNGTIKPNIIYDLKTLNPVPYVTSFNPSQILQYSSVLPQTEIDYDGLGRVVSSKNISTGMIASTIYNNGYDFSIASIQQSVNSKVAYTSFEDADQLGNIMSWNWSIYSQRQFDFNSPTGDKYGTGTFNISTPILIDEDYILSFWSNSNSITVSGQTPSQIGPVKNGWTYYEYKIPTGLSSPVLTGSGNIDELRLYPKKAILTTYTYRQGIFKTSECSNNNIINYYEYDQAYRLSLVRDADRNILKKYCYNNYGQTIDCNTFTCPTTAPDWQNTPLPRYCQIGPCGYTGYQIQEQRDNNPCSPTYNTIKQLVSAGSSSSSCIANNGLVTIRATNNINTAGFTATYTNLTTNQVYTFVVPAAGSSFIGCLPEGRYSLSITNPANNYILYYSTGCLTTSDLSAYFSSISISITSPLRCNNNNVIIDYGY